MSIYPEYKPKRSLFHPDPGKLGLSIVEIKTDKGVTGYGRAAPAAAIVIENHLTKLLVNEDPWNVERIWDINWRSTEYYGRKGLVVNAISGVDMALWDIIGKSLGLPVYRLSVAKLNRIFLLTAPATTSSSTSKFGFKRLKLAIPYGPADGREGMRKNVELVERRAKSTRTRRRHHARLLDVLDRAVHDGNRGNVRALPRVLDGRVPAAARL